MRERKFGRRVGVTSLVAVGAIAAFALIGGTGLAKELANPGKAQYGAGGQYHGKVTICHKGHVTIRVATVAWFRAHQHHGDTMGPCSAAAVKAAEVKAAKLKAKHGHTTTETGAATTTAPTTKHASKGKGKGHASSTSGDTGSSQATTTPSSPGHGNGHGKNG